MDVGNMEMLEKQYDLIAGEWARAFSGEHERKPKDQEILRRFSKEIGERKPVWDLGCGPGNTTAFLNRLGVETSGLDLSEGMIRQARLTHPDLYFRKADMLRLPFDDDSVAGIVSFYAIIHFTKEQVGRAFGEVFRVLRPGGIFLFTYHVGRDSIHLDEFLGVGVDIDMMFFDSGFMIGELKSIGFVSLDLIEREPYAGVEYESRRAYVFAKKPAAAA